MHQECKVIDPRNLLQVTVTTNFDNLRPEIVSPLIDNNPLLNKLGLKSQNPPSTPVVLIDKAKSPKSI